MREKQARVGLAREGDRRKNVYTALDLVRADIEPKIAKSVMLKPNLFASNEQITSTHADAIRGAIDFLLIVEPLLSSRTRRPINSCSGRCRTQRNICRRSEEAR